MGGPLPNALFFTIETLAEKIREKARSQCSIFDGGKVKNKQINVFVSVSFFKTFVLYRKVISLAFSLGAQGHRHRVLS